MIARAGRVLLLTAAEVANEPIDLSALWAALAGRYNAVRPFLEPLGESAALRATPVAERRQRVSFHAASTTVHRRGWCWPCTRCIESPVDSRGDETVLRSAGAVLDRNEIAVRERVGARKTKMAYSWHESRTIEYDSGCDAS